MQHKKTREHHRQKIDKRENLQWRKLHELFWLEASDFPGHLTTMLCSGLLHDECTSHGS